MSKIYRFPITIYPRQKETVTILGQTPTPEDEREHQAATRAEETARHLAIEVWLASYQNGDYGRSENAFRTFCDDLDRCVGKMHDKGLASQLFGSVVRRALAIDLKKNAPGGKGRSLTSIEFCNTVKKLVDTIKDNEQLPIDHRTPGNIYQRAAQILYDNGATKKQYGAEWIRKLYDRAVRL